MHRGLWNTDHASFFSEATLIEIGVILLLITNQNKVPTNLHNEISSTDTGAS